MSQRRESQQRLSTVVESRNKLPMGSEQNAIESNIWNINNDASTYKDADSKFNDDAISM